MVNDNDHHHHQDHDQGTQNDCTYCQGRERSPTKRPRVTLRGVQAMDVQSRWCLVAQHRADAVQPAVAHHDLHEQLKC